MGEQKDKLLKAKELYEQGNYIDSSDICSELASTFISSPDATLELNRELYMLVAKNMLFLSSPANIDDSRQTIAQSVGFATMFVETLEEYYAIEHEIDEAINDWQREWFCKNLDYIRNNPTRDNWKKYYLDNIMPLASLPAYISICISNLEHVEELFDSTEMEIEEIEEKYSIPETNEMTDEEEAEVFYETCCSIFDGIVNFVEANKHSSNEYLSTVGDKIINELLLSKLVIDASLTNETPEQLKYLRKKAEILFYMMTVIIYPNGRAVKVFSDTTDEVKELTRVYQKIKALDDSFEIPEIPAPRTKTAAKTNTSGGCYVATAVYGSYDCPEVWTLRRYRDNTLAKTWYGRAFIKTYYAISPTLVKWFGNTNWFRNMWKGKLDRMVSNLQSEGVESTPYKD